MIQLTLKSNITGKVVKSSYTARQLLESDEQTIVEEMSECNCAMKPRGETNVIECECYLEWEDYTLIIGDDY